VMKKMKPRILVISPLPPPYGGMANQTELYLSSVLVDLYNITILNVSPGLKREKDPGRPSLITAFYSICVVIKLLYVLVKTSPELVYMITVTQWGFVRDICIIMICKIFRKHLVCHLHSKYTGPLFLRKRGLRFIFHWVMLLPDKVVVLSENLKRQFSGLIRHDKLEVINNIVNTSLYDKLVEEEKAEGFQKTVKPITILFVGRLSKKKGIWDLLEAIALIAADGRNVIFELAGVAEYKEEEIKVFGYCDNPFMKDHVSLLGTISGKLKVSTFRNADIFVFPSHIENMPIVILEAMAAGLPIVSTNVGEIPDIIDSEINGFLVEPGDTKKLAEKLVTLIESPDLRDRIGRNNHTKARNYYDVEIGVRKLHKVFDDLLSERSPNEDVCAPLNA